MVAAKEKQHAAAAHAHANNKMAAAHHLESGERARFRIRFWPRCCCCCCAVQLVFGNCTFRARSHAKPQRYYSRTPVRHFPCHEAALWTQLSLTFAAAAASRPYRSYFALALASARFLSRLVARPRCCKGAPRFDDDSHRHWHWHWQIARANNNNNKLLLSSRTRVAAAHTSIKRRARRLKLLRDDVDDAQLQCTRIGCYCETCRLRRA